MNGQGSTPVILYDDGTHNDLVAGDGLYTGWYTPTALGDFQLRVSGTTTTAGSFSRVDSRRIRVQGLRVIAPSSATVSNGSSFALHFSVVSLENTPEIYLLGATSGNGWIQPPPASITIAAGGTVDVPVTVTVPGDAAPNSFDRIWLTAIKQSDSTIIAEDNTLVITPDVEGAGQLEHGYLPLLRR